MFIQYFNGFIVGVGMAICIHFILMTSMNMKFVDASHSENVMENMYNDVTFDNFNHVNLKGDISDDMVNKFLVDFHNVRLRNQLKKQNETMFVYIDSHGGEVIAGLKIVSEFRKHKVSCVVDRAYSMAFVILQACEHRYVTPTGQLMQHQMSYGIQGTHSQIVSQVNMMTQMNNWIVEFQARRIGMEVYIFEYMVSNDWWLFSDTALDWNCVDGIIDVNCGEDLIKTYRCPYFGHPKYLKESTST